MYQRETRLMAAAIILIGHFAIVAYGILMLVLFSPFQDIQKGIQVVLMASPVLAITAMAGLKHILSTATHKRRGKKVNAFYFSTVLGLPLVLIVSVLGLIYMVHHGIGNIGIEGLTLVLGAIETCFGAYIGLISDDLFGKQNDENRSSSDLSVA
ncbi:hypothetical protein [Hoeflea prorocentri]|uniref:Transmembrane protein n=1 Tax=Hoeflea prorocentri TaxID=1922333 RepID=A0A9X3UME7_9HYPH|nr:hypothetical protein [Hoeflea prorocentri]MCY6383274.1 hypothetical protein [Hoeflea prorocentri]MDA5401074.1 hypothetical protein [Hoeflea prorocentri]